MKPPPVPGQVKLLSLLAIVLVCAAPALVSIIDDSAQSDHMIAMGSYTEGETAGLSLSWKAETPADADKTFSFLSASQNDGTNVFILNNLTSKAYFNSINTGVYIANSDFDAGVSKIVLNIEGDVKSIRLVPLGDGLPYSFVNFKQIMTTDALGNEIGTNSWVLELDQIMLTKLKANDAVGSIQIYVGDDFDGTLSWTSETYASTTIAYGEIIIGATGALLCFCALMATPWFGIGRRSKS